MSHVHHPTGRLVYIWFKKAAEVKYILGFQRPGSGFIINKEIAGLQYARPKVAAKASVGYVSIDRAANTLNPSHSLPNGTALRSP